MEVFDGRPCSFQRSPGVLGSAGEASRELLEAYVWPLGALGGVLAEVSMTSEGPRGGLETEFVNPRGKWMMAKYTIIYIYIYIYIFQCVSVIFKNSVFSKECARGANDIV